ncbi:MetQ/NlpA family ABC transporter substrate-binding protein [Peptostreptococcus equinus]|uniref:Lipoprotein n=1 Tax=Peptostreptococcus equinus TaxID=3003601 RepID=A0ABY7JS76_9FIRM|nr:MetQ/NlpA family ABC transporter substrate-binding protein [Peptostreptococcus sp. CBA3647]WAW15696.1 MetQ/NlpA family ABC transporter substrate-binding protein [Peptostreptococcus sp. CBA3647]
MKIKKIATLALAAGLSLSLVACGSNKKESAKDDKKIVIGASANPHADILNKAVKPLLEKDGYKLEVKVFNDYILPNKALDEGSLDANFFQHEPYLNEYNTKNKTEIKSVAKVHLEPMGVYSQKVKSISGVKDKAVIAVPNDPTNETRALKILEKEGLIKLADKELLNKNDIKENKKNIEIKELAAEQLPTVLKDVDLAVINSNYALEAKLNPQKDAIATESKDSPYANIIAVSSKNKDSEKTKALIKAIQSPEVKTFINDTYKGAIIPSF